MKRLVIIGTAVAAAYFLGTKDGRAALAGVGRRISAFWNDPSVVRHRQDVVAYAQEQAPAIRARATSLATQAPGAVAGVAKDVATTVSSTATDVAGRVAGVATDVAGRVSDTATDVAASVSSTATEVAKKVSSTAQDVAQRAGDVVDDVRDKAESAVESAVTTAGRVRDEALASLDDDEDDDTSEPAKA